MTNPPISEEAKLAAEAEGYSYNQRGHDKPFEPLGTHVQFAINSATEKLTEALTLARKELVETENPPK